MIIGMRIGAGIDIDGWRGRALVDDHGFTRRPLGDDLVPA